MLLCFTTRRIAGGCVGLQRRKERVMVFKYLRRWFYRQFDLQFASYVKGQLDGLEARLGAKIDKLVFCLINSVHYSRR